MEWRYEGLAALAVCGTIAVFALTHGVGSHQTAIWVGLGVGVCVASTLWMALAWNVIPWAAKERPFVTTLTPAFVIGAIFMLAIEQWTAAVLATIVAALGIAEIVRVRPR
jgi:hypothetical protein